MEQLHLQEFKQQYIININIDFQSITYSELSDQDKSRILELINPPKKIKVYISWFIWIGTNMN